MRTHIHFAVCSPALTEGNAYDMTLRKTKRRNVRTGLFVFDMAITTAIAMAAIIIRISQRHILLGGFLDSFALTSVLWLACRVMLSDLDVVTTLLSEVVDSRRMPLMRTLVLALSGTLEEHEALDW